MKFHTVKVEDREQVGGYTVLRYQWDGEIEPGQFVMARAGSFPYTLDPFLARPLSFYDHDGETASLLFEVRGRGTALLDRPSRWRLRPRSARASESKVTDTPPCSAAA